MRSLDDVFAAAEGAAEETLAILRDLIQIPTVNTGIMPTGNEVAACDYISQKLGSDGVEVEVLHSAQGRANAIAELRGTRGNPRILFLSHTDVVPSGDESEWRYPPFSGKVADGRVWGRGAADMKDTLAAQIMAVLLLKRAGLTLGGGIRLVACADEETGGQYGIRWMAEHAPKMLCADYALNEGGGTPVTVDGKLAYLLPVGEKGRLEARITFRGTASHASTPWQGDNVLFKLDRALQRIGALEPSLDVSHDFFGRIAELMGLAEPIVQANVNAVADALTSRYPGVASNLRGHSRLTLVPTMVAGGVKSNSVPSVCSLVCDVRTLPDQNEAFVRRILYGLVAEIEGATYTLEYTAVPSASSPQSELAASLQRVTEAATGREDIHMVPCLTTGFTDSRVVRPFGTVVYGFTPEHPSVDPTIDCRIHGPNESTDIASLVFRTKVFAGVAWDLLRDGG